MGDSPKVHKPHAGLRARETTKEKHKPSKIDLWEAAGKPGAGEAGGTLSETGLRVTEETLGVKAANTEPALVIQ